MRRASVFLPLLLLPFASASFAAPPPPAARAAAGTITPAELRAHVRFLADDLLEGRGTGTRGDALAVRYVASQLEALGLEPAGDGGTFLQRFTMTGVTTHAPETTAFSSSGKTLALRRGEEAIVTVGNAKPSVSLAGAEVVFVGYGIVAPEYRWDDFKGTDVRGKVLLLMNNDPQSDPGLFAGKTRLYYGRWDYKYEEAARQGAAGVIVIHTTPSAGYPWQVVQTSWSGENFELPDPGAPALSVKAWVTEDAARKLVALAGKDLDALRASAESRDFRPVPLGVAWSAALTADVREVQGENVLARLSGSDPERSREAVVFAAHHDHLGMREDGRPGEDVIYNGAADNASGVAGLLAVARAMASLPEPPARSVFFASVAAEEQGLLGSRYLALHPPVAPGRLAAILNLDGLNTYGRTHDVGLVGMGKSEADAVVKALAAWQGRVVTGDAFPEQGHFYRSDQFSFARVGVPSVYLKAGMDVIGKPAGWGKAHYDEFVAKDYHQPTDEMKPDWDLSGAVEDARLAFHVGLALAQASQMPAWKAGDEFEAARRKAVTAAAVGR